MTRAEMARLLDHSVLKPEATESEVLAGSAAQVAAVAGFPHGCDEPAAAAKDIAEVVRAVAGIPVKLTDDQKRLACRLAVDAGAAFVKTSTGFHAAGGATVEDVRLMRAAVGPHIGVKASGGIRTLADARAMLAAGADRLGTSASAAILDALEASKR